MKLFSETAVKIQLIPNGLSRHTPFLRNTICDFLRLLVFFCKKKLMYAEQYGIIKNTEVIQHGSVVSGTHFPE